MTVFLPAAVVAVLCVIAPLASLADAKGTVCDAGWYGSSCQSHCPNTHRTHSYDEYKDTYGACSAVKYTAAQRCSCIKCPAGANTMARV